MGYQGTLYAEFNGTPTYYEGFVVTVTSNSTTVNRSGISVYLGNESALLYKTSIVLVMSTPQIYYIPVGQVSVIPLTIVNLINETFALKLQVTGVT